MTSCRLVKLRLLCGVALFIALRGVAQQTQNSAPPLTTAKLEFEVASVKENKDPLSESNRPDSNVPIDSTFSSSGDLFTPTGGLYVAREQKLLNYILFAYKIPREEVGPLNSQMPMWAKADFFDIEARAQGDPSKDEYRKMMQSLLAARFKLKIHTETRKVPVYALVLAKPGKTGPLLQLHPPDEPCSTDFVSPPGSAGQAANPGGISQGAKLTEPKSLLGKFPSHCSVLVSRPVDPATLPGLFLYAGRNMTMASLASLLSSAAFRFNIDRPFVDQTGLNGTVDYVVEWTFPALSPQAADRSGPSMVDAITEQLGLKMEKTEAPVEFHIIDHIEYPSAN